MTSTHSPGNPDSSRDARQSVSTAERPKLDRDTVVDAAIELIESDGAPACTMRAVASRLGVEPMSLYWHVANKDDLLDAVVARTLAPLATPGAPTGDWQRAIREFAHRFRRLLRERPNLAPLLAQRPAAGYLATKRSASQGLADLSHAGFTAQQSVDVIRMIVRFVFGFAIADAAVRSHPQASAAAPSDAAEVRQIVDAISQDDPARLFDVALDAMLTGIEATILRP